MGAREFLVTGGTGSLGSRVVDRLRGAGREVRVFSRSGEEGRVRAATCRRARGWRRPCKASRR